MREFFTRKANLGSFLKTETGMSRQGLLLILLVIIAGGGCIYFFTGLIRPGKGTEIQISHESLVKKPMPPQPKTDVAANTAKPSVEQKVAAATPEHNSGAEKSAPTKPAAKKKPSPPTQSGTKKGPVKSVSTKTVAEHSERMTATKSAAVPKKETADSKKNPTETANMPDKTEQDNAAVKSGSKPAKDRYTLLIGVYVMERSMLATKAKLKSAGLVPVVTKGPKKQEPMNRLFMGEFDSYSDASAEMKQIRKITSDAFILPEKGKYMLYAGSYFVRESAEKERDRLIDAGLKPVVKTMNVPVNTYRLTAGNFQSSKPAEMEAERLKKLGIKASIIK